MYRRSCNCFLLFVFVTKTSHANIDTYFEVNTFFYSEPVAISALKTGWNTPIQSGDIIFTTDRFELGVAWENWQLGLQYRYDYYFNFTPETANLIHASKNKIELIPGQQYPINLQVNGVRTRGFKLARSIIIKQGLSISSAFTLLEGVEFMSGGLWGQASAVSAKDYNVDFEVDYAYSKDPVFERRAEIPKSMGYSLDLVLSWLPTKSIEMKLEILDVFSKVKWNNAPYTKATGDSNNKEYDESGYVKYNPVISGVESNRDYTQKIPRKIFIGGSYQILDEYALALEYSDFDVEDFLYFGLSRSINEHKKVSVLYCIEAHATSFSYLTRNFSLELITDKISVNKARLFGLKLSYVLMTWR